MSRRARRLLLAGAIVGFATSLPHVAEAHAELAESDPPAGAVLDESPERIVLRFTESVDPVDEALRLVASDGSLRDLLDVGQAGGDDSITATLAAPLEDGGYVIAWSALSADSHPISGAIPFSVGVPSEEVSTLADELAAGDEEPRLNELLLGYGRLTSYAGALFLMGTAGVVSIVLPSLLAERRTATALLVASLVGAIGTAAMLAGQSHRITGSFVDWTAVVSTHAGLWWSLRLVVFVGALLVVPDIRRLGDARARAVGAGIAIVTFAVVALGGHAVSGSSQQLGLVATIVHLLAAAMWIGALVVLVVLAPAGDRWVIAPRISLLALASVVALAATGAVNGWRQLTGIDDLVDTGYGRWLTAKLAILAIVLVVAAASRHAVHGGVLGRSRTPSGRLDDPAAEAGVPQRTRMLERNVVIELAGIAVILVLTVGLTSTVPPRAIGAVTAADDATGATTSATVDGLVMELELRPARPGPNSLRVTVMSPVEPVVPDEITVTAELTSEQIGPIDLPVEPVAPGTVTSDSAILPAQGGWTFVVTARFGDFDQTVFRAELDVSD